MGSTDNNIALPSLDFSTDSSNLVTPGIEGKLQQNVIKQVYMEQESSIRYPAYIIDIRNEGPIMPGVIKGLRMIVDDRHINPDDVNAVNLYIITANNSRIRLGYGDGMLMYKVLEPYIRATCKKSRIYYGTSDKSMTELQKMSMQNVRLDL